MKQVFITLFLISFSFNANTEERDCSWFASLLYQCKENFSCRYKPTPKSPELTREIMVEKGGCLHKEELPGGLKLECKWGGQVERSYVRQFYMKLINKGEIDPKGKYKIGNQKGPNPIRIGLDTGKCKIYQGSKEMKYDDATLNKIMLGSVTTKTKTKMKSLAEFKKEVKQEPASPKDKKALIKYLKEYIEQGGKIKSFKFMAEIFSSEAMSKVFDSLFYITVADVNGQRGSQMTMIWGNSGIEIMQKRKSNGEFLAKHINNSFNLLTEEDGKLLLKALHHIKKRQDYENLEEDGFTREAKKDGKNWIIYDAHTEMPDRGFSVKTDGEGKVLSIDSYLK